MTSPKYFKLIHRTSYFFLLTSSFLLSLTSALAATPLLCNPYTFVGRITDSRRTAFDDQRTATLSAYDTSNKLLARATTFYRDDSPNNYRLAIPMASSAADGCALQNDSLLITATDDLGRLWTAVIDPATVGAPGTISEVDIILSEDADGDGIDDTLYEELLAEYSASGLAAGGAPFDPRTDHDGDGITTLDEARLGTDPFNGDDTLRIESLDLTATPPTLTATLPAGHVYTLESTPSLIDPTWTPLAPADREAAANRAIRETLIPLVETLALRADARLIPVHSVYPCTLRRLPDGTHPDQQGARLLADTIYSHITAP